MGVTYEPPIQQGMVCPHDCHSAALNCTESHIGTLEGQFEAVCPSNCRGFRLITNAITTKATTTRDISNPLRGEETQRLNMHLNTIRIFYFFLLNAHPAAAPPIIMRTAAGPVSGVDGAGGVLVMIG